MKKFNQICEEILNKNIYYHISPFKFDKFELSKCGSGMGTSFWGYGIYFCKNEDTIKYYYDQMKDSYKQLFKYEVSINSTLIGDETKKYMDGVLSKNRYKIDYSVGHLYEEDDLLANDKTVGEIYYELAEANGEKEASLKMLNKYKVDGIVYYTEEDGNSIVIFNEDCIKILNVEEMKDE